MKTINQLILAGSILVSRFGMFPANFSPVGSFGFFGGNWILFALSIVVHDYLKGGFYPGFWLTYIGFAGYLVLGKLAQNHWQKKLLLLPLASLLFFVFSNLGVWWYWYPHTVNGLVTCFMWALPFYRNTFLSDLIFGYGYLAIRYLARKQTLLSVSPVIAAK